MSKNFRINLDLKRPECTPLSGFKQGDNLATINGVVLQDSIPYNLTGLTLRVNFKLPDGTVKYQAATLTNASAGEFSLVVLSSILAKVGTVFADISVFEGDKKITSSTFKMIVAESVYDNDATIGEEEKDLLQQIIDNEAERVSAEKVRKSNEIIRIENEDIRKANEIVREDNESKRKTGYSKMDTRIDNLVLGQGSIAEVTDAHLDSVTNVTYTTLKARLDNTSTEVVALKEGKINYTDIVDNLIDGGVKKVLSAEQGKKIGESINTLTIQSEKLAKGLNDIVANVKMFGAKGDGATDDTLAIQAAIDSAQQSGGNVYLPAGVYLINKALTLKDTPISITGSNYNSATIKATVAMVDIFKFEDIKRNVGFQFSDFRIDANYMADHGIYSNTLTHTKFDRIYIRGTKLAAIKLGNAWCNDMTAIMIQYNTGNGIEFMDSSNHLNNLINSKVLLCDGFGIFLQSGRNLNIKDCQIQENKKGGIYHSTLGGPISILDNYFEDNGTIGWVSAQKTIKADVIINGSATIGDMGAGYLAKQIKISGNSHHFTSNLDAAYYLIACKGIEITNNLKSTKDTTPMVGIYIDNRTSNVINLQIGENEWPEKEFLHLDNVVEGKWLYANTWDISNRIKANYISDDFETWETNYPFVSSTLTLSTEKFHNKKTGIITMQGNGNSNYFGTKVNTVSNPELAGRQYYFSVWVKQSSTTMGANINLTSTGRNAPYPNVSTEWREIVHIGKFPDAGVEQISIQLYAGKTGETLKISMPALTLIGTQSNKFYI